MHLPLSRGEELYTAIVLLSTLEVYSAHTPVPAVGFQRRFHLGFCQGCDRVWVAAVAHLPRFTLIAQVSNHALLTNFVF
jgi:hypothetical protein